MKKLLSILLVVAFLFGSFGTLNVRADNNQYPLNVDNTLTWSNMSDIDKTDLRREGESSFYVSRKKVGNKNQIQIYDKSKNIVLPFGKCDDIWFAGNGMFVIKKDNKYCLLDKNFNDITGFIYDGIFKFNDYDAFVVFVGDLDNDDYKTGIINTKGEVLVPVGKYDISQQNAIEVDGKVLIAVESELEDGDDTKSVGGFIDENGKEIIAPMEYPRYSLGFVDGIYQGVANGKSVFYDSKGNEVTNDVTKRINSIENDKNSPYKAAVHFPKNKILVVDKSGKKGIIDSKGKVIIPIKYESIWLSKEKNIIHLEIDSDNISNYRGLADLDGNIIIEANKYIGAELANNGFDDIIVSMMDGENTIYGMLDKNGNELFQPKYNLISDPRKVNGNCYYEVENEVSNQNKYGLIDRKGNIIYNLQYSNINSGSSFYDKDYNGKREFEVNDVVDLFKEVDGKELKGIGNLEGNVLVPIKYNRARVWGFDENSYIALAGYEVGIGDDEPSKTCIYSKEGKLMHSSPYLYSDFCKKSGLAIVYKSYGYVGTKAKYKYGLMNADDKLVLDIKYDNIEYIDDDTFRLEKDGKYAILKNPLPKAKRLTSKQYYDKVSGVSNPTDSSVDTNNENTNVNGNTNVNENTGTVVELNYPKNAIAKPTNDKLSVDGKVYGNIEVYKIDGSNYFKLRDIAMIANGTDSKFSVGWDEKLRKINLVKTEPYVSNGEELKKGNGKNKKAILSDIPVIVNGSVVRLISYNINGNTYYQIRPLAKALDFGVGYDASTKTIVLEMNK